jgi:hypothetical protein
VYCLPGGFSQRGGPVLTGNTLKKEAIERKDHVSRVMDRDTNDPGLSALYITLAGAQLQVLSLLLPVRRRCAHNPRFSERNTAGSEKNM